MCSESRGSKAAKVVQKIPYNADESQQQFFQHEKYVYRIPFESQNSLNSLHPLIPPNRFMKMELMFFISGSRSLNSRFVFSLSNGIAGYSVDQKVNHR